MTENLIDEKPGRSATAHDAPALNRDLIRIVRTVRVRAGAGKLSVGQTAALWTVAENAPIRATDLAVLEEVTGPTMSRVLACLTEKGFVERTSDEHDRRVSLFAPTAAGLDFLGDSSTRRSAVLAEALARMEPADRAQTVAGIRKLADAIGELPRAAD